MGTANFDITKYARNRGLGAGTVPSDLVDSGAHTTSTTASNLTNGAAGAGDAVVGVKGDVLHIEGSEAMRVSFGGVAATASSGHYLAASLARDIEIPVSGAISIIDVA